MVYETNWPNSSSEKWAKLKWEGYKATKKNKRIVLLISLSAQTNFQESHQKIRGALLRSAYFIIFFSALSAGDQIQCHAHATQVLYHTPADVAF